MRADCTRDQGETFILRALETTWIANNHHHYPLLLQSAACVRLTSSPQRFGNASEAIRLLQEATSLPSDSALRASLRLPPSH